LEQERPDVVIVQGDTSTVMGAAVAAFNRRVPVIHLEAGLRSGDIDSPFPEEANRKLTSQIAALHLAPTQTSKSNLTREDVSENDIVITGNSVVDTLMYATENLDVRFEDERLEALRQAHMAGTAGRVLLVTAHRRQNLGSVMEGIGQAVAEIARKYPDLTVVFPIHRNPKVRAAIRPAVEGVDNVLLIEPLAYAEFTRALSIAHVVLTDSGGVQEEAPSLGKPDLVMRNNTERPEAVIAGTVKLIGTHPQRPVDQDSLLLESEEATGWRIACTRTATATRRSAPWPASAGSSSAPMSLRRISRPDSGSEGQGSLEAMSCDSPSAGGLVRKPSSRSASGKDGVCARELI